LGEAAEAVEKEAGEKKPLLLGKHRLALSQDRQPNRESIRQSFERRRKPAAIALPE